MSKGVHPFPGKQKQKPKQKQTLKHSSFSLDILEIIPEVRTDKVLLSFKLMRGGVDARRTMDGCQKDHGCIWSASNIYRLSHVR